MLLSRAQSMAAILERMIVLYERCLEILNRERNDLVTVDFDSLLANLREKDEILEAIRALDRDRLKIQDEFARVMEMDPEVLTLKMLGDSLVSQGGDAEYVGRRLLSLRRNLSAVIGALGEKVKNNKVFVEKGLQNIRDVASILSEKVSGVSAQKNKQKKSSVYTKKALVTQTSEAPKGSLVERRY